MRYTYPLTGMHCNACIDKIKNAISPHFNNVEVTLTPPQMVLEAESAPSEEALNKLLFQAGNYHIKEESLEMNNTSSYYPLFLIVGYLLGITLLNQYTQPSFNGVQWMNQFMAGFFLVFSAFKLLDLKGFAEGYSTYDLLAKYWYSYGYIYPFLELLLGILYLTQFQLFYTNIFTILIMGFSSLGVINSLLKKQKFQCACLGTILKVPLSWVTLIEDLTMVVLALLSLLMWNG